MKFTPKLVSVVIGFVALQGVCMLMLSLPIAFMSENDRLSNGRITGWGDSLYTFGLVGDALGAAWLCLAIGLARRSRITRRIAVLLESFLLFGGLAYLSVVTTTGLDALNVATISLAIAMPVLILWALTVNGPVRRDF